MENIELKVAEGTRFERNITITGEDIDDIIATAFDSGISYWCNKAEVIGDYFGSYASDQISRNGQVKIYVDEPVNDTDMFVLTKDNFLAGLKQYIEDPEKPYVITRRENDKVVLLLENVDADVADMIIQYALFDEIVFG